MASRWVQGKGVAKFGPTGSLVDYSDQVTNVTFSHSAAETEIPATFETGEGDVELGAKTRTLQVDFLDGLAAADFAAELSDAFGATDGELDFDVVFDADAAVGVNNKRHTGTIVVATFTHGGPVGGARTQSQTYRIKSGTYTTATV
jgi:hypothetical protein